MAQTHDGGFVVMPGRDYASTDHVYGTRNFPTACAALILSVKEKRLRITGAPNEASGKSESSVSSLSRPARSLSEEKRALLDESLLKSLAELSHSGKLKPLAMSLSKAQTKIWLSAVESDLKLTFQALRGTSKASFAFTDLTEADHVLLARLAAQLKPEDTEAQALAGIYVELSGDTTTADKYYARAGDEIQATLEQLFE